MKATYFTISLFKRNKLVAERQFDGFDKFVTYSNSIETATQSKTGLIKVQYAIHTSGICDRQVLHTFKFDGEEPTLHAWNVTRYQYALSLLKTL